MGLVAIGLCLGGPVYAADAAPNAAAPVYDDAITVTATRREESALNVPIALTALSAQALSAKQITNVMDLAQVVPGLQIKTTYTPLEITTSLRGVTQYLPSINTDPPTGIYVDGVYYAINAGSNLALIDLERVEVLKGPQGTLFGRNTIGGAISITTAKPKDELGGSVQLDAGNYDTRSATVVGNVPVVPGVVDTRFVYQHSEHDGYGENFTTGNPTATLNQDYLRGTVKITPAPDWQVLVSGFYANAKGFGPATQLAYVNPNAAAVPAALGLGPNNTAISALAGRPGDLLTNYIFDKGTQDSYSGLDNNFRLEQYGFTGTIEGTLAPDVSVRSITGYTHTYYNAATSISGSPYTLINVLDFPIRVSQFSQELQVYGNGLDDRLDWIAGAYFFDETGSQRNKVQSLPDVARTFGAPATFSTAGPEIHNRSYSAFAQVTYEVIPGLRLTGGIRYVVDERKVTYEDHTETATAAPVFVACSLANGLNPSTGRGTSNPVDCVLERGVKYDYVPWTLGIDYKPSDQLLLYAKLSKGYRSGAFSLSGPPLQAVSAACPLTTCAIPGSAGSLAQFQPVAPERLLSPELGLKLDTFNHKLSLDAAAYYSWYDNVQLSTPGAPPCAAGCVPLQLLVNSGKVEIWGGELQGRVHLGKFTLDGAAGYTRPKYVAGYVGQPVINISKFNGSLTGSYPVETSAGVLTLTGTYAYRSSFYLNQPSAAYPAAQNAIAVQEGYALLNARADFRWADLPLVISLYGQNLANRHYSTSLSQFAPPLGFSVRWPGAPRTYGVSAKYEF